MLSSLNCIVCMYHSAALRHPTVVMKMGAYHNRNPMISDPNTEGSVPHFAWNYPGNIFSATKIGLNPFQASPMDPKPDLFTAVSLHSFAPMTEPAKNDTESETKPTKVKKKKSAAKSSDQNAPKVSRTQKKSSASKKTKKQFEPGTKIERKDPNMVFNEANLDFSVVPPPYCSCTGVARSCYKWGTGGWQSSCCNTNISEYPLPMSPSKPGARVPGRKMSIGAYGKLLCRLAAEGLDLSHPVDLKDHWARHGFCGFQWSCSPIGYDLLVQVSDLQADYGLEETSSIAAAGKIGVLQHLLGNFTIELGRDVTEMALNINEFI
ncbi:unnamed protein product [Camellia sinensis]